MPIQASGAAIDPAVPISAIEEELRRLGLNMSQGVPSVMPPPEFVGGQPQPQSAVEAIMAERDKRRAAMVAAAAPPPPATTPPPTELAPEEPVVAKKTAEGDGGGISPWWMLPLAIAALAGRKGLARKAKGGKKTVDTAAGEMRKPPLKHPGRAYGPHQPYGPQRPPPKPGPGGTYGPTQPHNYPPSPPVYGPHRPAAGAEPPLDLTDVVPTPGTAASSVIPNADGTLPPPTLTRTDVTSEIPLALAERARGNIRVPGEGQLPPPPPVTPRPILPTYTAPLDEAADLGGSELAKAIRVSGQIARDRARSAAKTERVNRRRPGAVGKPPQQFTPDRRVPREEGERKSFNEVVEAIRDAKRPLKEAVKDLKPWLKEPKKAYVGPELPKKKPGPKPKRKGPPKPAVAQVLAKRKIETARKGKTTPKTLSERKKAKGK